MMWRGVRNCPFWPAEAILPEHVLVEVALRVALLHRHLVEHVDDLRQQARLVARQREARILHVLRVRRAFAAEGAEEGEDVIGDDVVHLARLVVLEARPAQLVVRAAAGVLPRGKDDALQRRAEARGLQLFDGLQIIQTANEKQIRDLLDHLERIGDASRPERVPNAVDLTADFAREHALAVYRASTKVRSTLEVGNDSKVAIPEAAVMCADVPHAGQVMQPRLQRAFVETEPG
jgi:hypothetical protein